MAVNSIANAYVKIIPTIEPGAIKATLGKATAGTGAIGTAAGKNFSSGFGTAMKIGIAAAVTTGIYALSRFTGAAIKSASEFQDVSAAANVIFGDSFSKPLEDFANAASKNFGASKLEALNAASSFATFGKSAGLGGKDLFGFSTNLAQLAGDMASFKGTSTEQAITAVGAALRGESEPIRAYGVLLDDATLKAEAMAMGIYSGTGALTPQQKVLAAQAAILKQTTDAQGDYLRTSDSAANSARSFQANLSNLEINMGTKLLPAFAGIMSPLSDFLVIIADAIMPAINAFGDYAETVLVPMFGQVTDNIKNGKPWLEGFGTDFLAANTFIEPLVGTLEKVVGFIGDLFNFIKDNFTLLATLAGIVVTLTTAFKVGNTALAIWNGLQIAYAAVTAASTATTTAFSAALAATGIGLIVIAVAALIAGIIYLATQTTFFQDLWTAMVAGVTAGWNAFVGFFQVAITSIGGFFNSVFTGIGNAFKGYINFWIGLIEGFVNFFIDGINMILKGFNSIKFTAPDWLPLIGGMSFGVNIPMLGKINLPRLAEGGLVMPSPGGTIANIAEAGKPEVVYPLDRFEAMMGLNGAGNGSPITVNNYAPVGMDSEQQITRAIERARQVGW